jgi:hypothetical protein
VVRALTISIRKLGGDLDAAFRERIGAFFDHDLANGRRGKSGRPHGPKANRWLGKGSRI